MPKRVRGVKALLDNACKDVSGSATINSAILFGVIAMAIAGLATPFIKDAADTYAQNRALGIDRAITGSVKETKRYTIRRSVIDPEGTIIRQ